MGCEIINPVKKVALGIYLIGIFGTIAAVYFFSLPITVQAGDTGELVAAAERLFVPHPPGYPLFIWVQHFFLSLSSSLGDFGSVFFRASFLNMIFSLVTLGLLWGALKQKPYVALGVVGLLAFSRVFWRYSELPDVFSLNSLFTALLLYLYFAADNLDKKSLLLPFVFCLGLTNHHTLIFLSPLVLDILWKHKKEKGPWISLALGILSFSFIYGTLCLMNPSSIYSWGELNSFSSLLDHILRRDYGTFKLLGNHQEASVWKNYGILIQESFLSFYPLILSLLALLAFRVQIRLERKEKFLLGSLGLYVFVFFSLANNAHSGFQIEVFDRFMIFFQVTLVFLLGRILVQASSPKLVPAGLSVIFLLAVCGQYALWNQENNFSKNTVVEDYVVNLLNQAPENKKTIALLASDTRFFAARYAQSVLGIRTDVTILSPREFFFPWFSEKMKGYPGLQVDANRLYQEQTMDVQRDLILPNLNNFDVITPLIFTDSNLYKITILPLGRKLSLGSGIDIANDLYKKIRLRSTHEDLKSNPAQYDVFRELISDYAMSLLIQGRELERLGRPKEALTLFQQTLLHVPWCFPASESACRIMTTLNARERSACEDSVQELRRKYFDYN
jgi:hypothetical protein